MRINLLTLNKNRKEKSKNLVKNLAIPCKLKKEEIIFITDYLIVRVIFKTMKYIDEKIS